mmetsp:Transcript_11994/g.33192  ORF Transcript_11994/g.33192 Transcript_11994/m.33192 type:complete len:388 (+) Transcript_11994:1856-3019(+)
MHPSLFADPAVSPPDLAPCGELPLGSTECLRNKAEVHCRHCLGGLEQQTILRARPHDQCLVREANAVRNLDGSRAQEGNENLELWPRLHKVTFGSPWLRARSVHAVLARGKTNGIHEDRGPADAPLPRPVRRTVVVTRPDLRHRWDLQALKGVSWESHTVLNVHVVGRCCCPHLQEPRSPKRCILQQLGHSQKLRPKPILLVRCKAPLPRSLLKQVVPKCLVRRERVRVRCIARAPCVVHKLEAPSMELVVLRSVAPKAIVSREGPTSLLTKLSHPSVAAAEHVVPRFPQNDGVVRWVSVIPPGVKQNVFVRNTFSLAVLIHVHKRCIHVLALLWIVIVVRTFIGCVTQVLVRDVILHGPVRRLAVIREHVVPPRPKRVVDAPVARK